MSSPSGVRGRAPAENEFGAFVAARRTLIAIVRIVSAVMDVETHTAKHEQQKCDRWRRSIVVRTLVSAGELSLSCARLLAG